MAKRNAFGEAANGPGAKPHLFLFHAMGLNSAVWSPNAKALSERFVVYAFDTIGDQVYVVGNSMGGWIANAAALYHPETIKAVALISPAVGIPKRMKWGSMIISMMVDQSEKNLRKISANLLGPYDAERDWADYMTHAPKETASAKLGIPSSFTDEELRSIHVPVLLLVGDSERIYADTREVFTRAKSLMPDVICQTIPDAGHVGAYDNPEYVNSALIRFFLDPR